MTNDTDNMGGNDGYFSAILGLSIASIDDMDKLKLWSLGIKMVSQCKQRKNLISPNQLLQSDDSFGSLVSN